MYVQTINFPLSKALGKMARFPLIHLQSIGRIFKNRSMSIRYIDFFIFQSLASFSPGFFREQAGYRTFYAEIIGSMR